MVLAILATFLASAINVAIPLYFKVFLTSFLPRLIDTKPFPAYPGASYYFFAYFIVWIFWRISGFANTIFQLGTMANLREQAYSHPRLSFLRFFLQ